MTDHRHALDPLTNNEIATAVAVVRRDSGLDESAWFETVTLDEPSREEGDTPDIRDRRAYVCCYAPSSGHTFNGIVQLAQETLLRWDHIPGVQARIVADEFAAANRIAKADERFRAALAKRGITDLDAVLVESWAPGNFGIDGEDGERLAYGHCWVANEAGDNPTPGRSATFTRFST